MNQSVMVDLPSLPDTQGRGPSTEELHPSYGPLGMSVVFMFLFLVNGGEHSSLRAVPSLG